MRSFLALRRRILSPNTRDTLEIIGGFLVWFLACAAVVIVLLECVGP
jgi:hypothetical protein